MGLEALRGAIDGLAEDDPATWADPESLVELQRQLARLDAYVSAASAAFDTSGAWADDGARSAPAWLATRCRLPRAQARRQVRRGRALRHLPATAAAFMQGGINGAHVDAIAALRRPGTEALLERDEAMLVSQAGRLSFAHFTRALAYWEQRADPDGVEEAAAAGRERRDVFIASSFGGMWLGQITLDPVSGAIVASELERLEAELFEEDWGKARAELGREPKVHELRRTAPQRRADALVEMATRSRSTPDDARRPEPLFTVLVGYETLRGRICQLAQGMALAPGSLVPWLDRAWLERAVFEPGGRIEVGIRARLFTGGTRRAIEVRDQECTHPYCDEPAHRCQADHIIPYSQGGFTTQDNGRLLCPFHNRMRNQRPPPDD
ncbi:MAG TPA: DUF222 domain-containing protein [Acidimicrobiales bacterium]|nr:DUF222 domain-containing protein [Acidimicrobiales bacterium]